MTPIVWGLIVLAVALGLVLLRVLWTTRGANQRKLQKLIDLSKTTIEEKNHEIDRLRKSDELLREANRKLRDANSEIEDRDRQIKGLKTRLEVLTVANTKLNEILGNQEAHINAMQKDMDMLKTQVFELRAKLGLPL